MACPCHHQHYSFFLPGGMPGAAEKIVAMLLNTYDGIRIVGSHCPPFRTLTAAEEIDLVATINAAGPDSVRVGLGSPKQDPWNPATSR